MRHIVIATLALVALTTSASAQYGNFTCEDLYVARNQIFKERGLCFTRPAAIRRFGNAGCQYDDARDLPLSLREKRLVEQIVQLERMRGCGRDGREW